MIQLSVVLITRNQEWNVRSLIESVLNKASPFLSVEVLLVDSASTDKTVSIASEYPINIIVLDADQRLTAAAGRCVGYQHTSGHFVLFLDGDMELYEGWLEKALEILIQNPTIAVITGDVIDRPKMTPHDDFTFKAPLRMPDFPVNVKQSGGAALYRRAVLEQVGTFNPYLYSDEEPELCLRIRRKGYRVVKLAYPIALHYTDPENDLSTLIARSKRRLYLGAGQNLRHHLGTDLFLPYLKERGFGLAPAGGAVVGIGCLALSLKSRRFGWFGAWLVAVVGIVALFAALKRSLYAAVYSLLLRLLIMDGTIRGFFLTPLTAETAPLKFRVVKVSEELAGLQARKSAT